MLRKMKTQSTHRFIDHQTKIIGYQKFMINFMLVVGGLVLTASTLYSTYLSININKINNNIDKHIKEEINEYISKNNEKTRSNDIANYLRKKIYVNDHQGTFLRIIERDKPLTQDEVQLFIEEAKAIAKSGKIAEKDAQGFRNLILILSNHDQNIYIDSYFRKITYDIVESESYGINYIDLIMNYYLPDINSYHDEIKNLLNKEKLRILENVKAANMRQRNKNYRHTYENHPIQITHHITPIFYKKITDPSIKEIVHNIVELDPHKLKRYENSLQFIEDLLHSEHKRVLTDIRRKHYRNEHKNPNAAFIFNVKGLKKQFNILKTSLLFQRIQELKKPTEVKNDQ